ncbi:hypothetical protein CCHL11_04146 [Colletotrichum chlorophyti]|uniref:Uncharacterized protein n=1 Tax=Colletotrichum chlorophyti TaxID=708187 RepID=A0A1Q8RPI9_9PEZI|nr:hypothetical protein CCHL11_04146 [Colletotrichum chlorophyti]
MILLSNLHPSFWHGALLGLVSGLLLSILGALVLAIQIFRRQDVYDNDHWKLNVKMPFTTMWMNMGYWTAADGRPILDFEEACCALLHEVLAASGVLMTDCREAPLSQLAILDLGIGCGDQSRELAQLARRMGCDDFHYVGLTLNDSQFQLASNQVRDELQKPTATRDFIKVFRADAARPDTWGPEIDAAIKSLVDANQRGSYPWVLGLDSMYHFFPSRRPIINYAARELGASFMAFDLILNSAASLQQRLLVKLIGIAMGCPSGAFLTEREYKMQLTEAGYDERQVLFQDVTNHVFPGLVGYMKRQEQALRLFGISMAKFKVAGKVFGWFASSGVLRASIVVAHRKPKTT